MKYEALPVEVDAFVIVHVNNHGSFFSVLCSDEPAGSEVFSADPKAVVNLTAHNLEPGMTARYTPVPGDYYVIQSDGYVYVNPKEVFERKYRLVPATDAPLEALHEPVEPNGEPEPVEPVPVDPEPPAEPEEHGVPA